MSTLKDKRVLHRIKRKVEELKLDLTGYTVLTEVGSALYNFTPVIAALANAKKVYAYTRDSKYGLAENIIGNCSRVLKELKLTSKVSFHSNKVDRFHIGEADIITNSGFLRPLGKEKLKYTKENVVIPLMYEKWELRESDVDIDYCKERMIKVAGTWENHPDLMVFEHVGSLALKMALNAGYEIYNNKIIVWSDDHFGELAERAFLNVGAKETILTTDERILYESIDDVDFIFICDYDEQKEYGTNSFFNFTKLQSINSHFGIVHLYGKIDFAKNKDVLANVFPQFDGHASLMSHTLGYVGINPIIDLQIAGFKVAESLLKNSECEFSQLI